MTGWLRNVFGADKAEDAQRLATQQSVSGQTDALNYLKEREAVPNEVRDTALKGLLQYFQGAGAPKAQDELVQEALASPLYKQLMGTKQGALDAVARYASATGKLRSGNAVGALAREGQRVDENALTTAFNAVQGNQNQNLAGLLSLSGTPVNNQGIANGIAGIGNTQAQGTIAQANTQTGATNNVFGTLLGLGSLGIQSGLLKV